MLPVIKRLKERKEKPQAAGIIVENRNEAQKEPSNVEAIEPYAVAMLVAIAANDHKALAQAMIDAHDEMHAQMDKEPQASPHTFEAQNVKTNGEY